MRDSKREQILAQLADDLADLTRRTPGGARPAATVAANRLADYAARGFPAGGTGGGIPTGTSDPVLRLIEAGVRDPYTAARHELDLHLEQAAAHLRQAARISAANLLHRIEKPPEPDLLWCSSCSRVKDSQGRHHHEPIHATPPGGSPLCRWCYDFRRGQGVLPPLPIIEARLQGKKITQTMVDRYLQRPSTGA